MKRLLPIFIFLLFFFSSITVYAQTPTATPTPVTAPTATPTPDTTTTGAGAIQPIPGCIGGPNDPWRCDEEVTFIGKSASRSKDFLNWTMAHYRWAEWKEDNPIGLFWARIRNIMYALLFLFVLATGFILVITRGKSVTVMKFIPRFVFILIFATLSFAIVQFLYQISDIVMGFFLQGPGLKPETIDPTLKVISGNNLFYIGWEYQNFIGYRLNDPSTSEAAFMSILLIKLTSITFYIMATLLLIRKVILWLFIAVSPVFPFLLLYYPIRNTGKIWIGEFFRWLLYGPLFAIFLYGLVALWQFQPPGAVENSVGIPLNFDTTKAGKPDFIKYPTAINIVIGGPGQTISRENNVNLPDTFVLYVFALIMVWVVTFFPFVLLRIFLEHMNNMLSNENWITRQLGKTPFGRPPSPPPVKPVMPAGPIIPPTPTPPQGAPTGMAKQMPTGAALRPQDAQVNQQILKNANLSVPTLRDIARMETASITNTASQNQEISRTQSSLEKIANPASTTNSVERSQYTLVREKLLQESQKGNLMAKSILSAANTVSVASMPQQTISQVVQKVGNPTIITNPVERHEFTQLKETLQQESSKGNQLASSILSVSTAMSQTEKSSTSILEQVKQDMQLQQVLHEKSEKGDVLATAILQATNNQQINEEQASTVVKQIKEAEKTGNPIATQILETIDKKDQQKEQKVTEVIKQLEEAKEKGDPVAGAVIATIKKQQTGVSPASPLPTVNRIQAVSLDDYEAVKKMWKENYQKLEPPQGIERKAWISKDEQKITETINLLSSADVEKQKQGMQMVSNILPFLMIGGFSKSEVIAYLKAKQEAGKDVLELAKVKEEEEESKVAAGTTAKAEQKTMTMEAEEEEPKAEAPKELGEDTPKNPGDTNTNTPA